MDIDARIKLIMEKMKDLEEKSPEFSCGEFPPKWDSPLSENVIEEFEKKMDGDFKIYHSNFINDVPNNIWIRK